MANSQQGYSEKIMKLLPLHIGSYLYVLFSKNNQLGWMSRPQSLGPFKEGVKALCSNCLCWQLVPYLLPQVFGFLVGKWEYSLFSCSIQEFFLVVPLSPTKNQTSNDPMFLKAYEDENEPY
jgi:hypothetical protein